MGPLVGQGRQVGSSKDGLHVPYGHLEVVVDTQPLVVSNEVSAVVVGDVSVGDGTAVAVAAAVEAEVDGDYSQLPFQALLVLVLVEGYPDLQRLFELQAPFVLPYVFVDLTLPGLVVVVGVVANQVFLVHLGDSE